MTEQASSQYRSGSRAQEESSSWAAGFVLFAGLMMVMTGVFQAINGLVALFENEFYVVTQNYLFEFDLTTWGWTHLILGVVVALAGGAVMAGRVWGRTVGVVLALLSAGVNFLFIPYYPIWSILIITLNVFVIWALVAHGRDLQKLTT